MSEVAYTRRGKERPLRASGLWLSAFPLAQSAASLFIQSLISSRSSTGGAVLSDLLRCFKDERHFSRHFSKLFFFSCRVDFFRMALIRSLQRFCRSPPAAFAWWAWWWADEEEECSSLLGTCWTCGAQRATDKLCGGSATSERDAGYARADAAHLHSMGNAL